MNIGATVRAERQKRNISAEYLAKRLSKPISRQAFLQHERKNSFKADTLQEIAKLIGCKVTVFFNRDSNLKLTKGDLRGQL